MAQFMYLIRNEGADFSKYSANDFQELMKKYQAWTQKIKTEGQFLAGEKLTNDLGKSLRIKQREIVVDGPYADSKDAIGGFYIIEAKNQSEALELARDAPLSRMAAASKFARLSRCSKARSPLGWRGAARGSRRPRTPPRRCKQRPSKFFLQD